MAEQAFAQDFEIAGLHVQPRERVVRSASCQRTLEPLVMKLLILLSQRPGQLAPRSALLQACWGSASVGDDSLNRIVAALRRALRETCGEAIRVDTVAGAGYVLRLGPAPSQTAESRSPQEHAARILQLGIDSWRIGLPKGDWVVIEELKQLCAAEPDRAQGWGLLALSLRHAAEYEPPEIAAQAVLDCERAARRALQREPHEPYALTALASVVPLFGSWSTARRRLLEVLEHNADHPVPTQDLATLEMATGFVRKGKALRDRLIVQDPLAAVSCYKSVYQHWSVGDLAGMDHVADRSVQLWPAHPAVWTVRLWTYAFTGRGEAALAMVRDSARPAFPPEAMRFLSSVMSALVTRNESEVHVAVAKSLAMASQGPAGAVQAMFALGLFGRLEDLFQVADAYYLRSGNAPVPLQHGPSEPALNEQHRRLTQVLFTPVFREARRDARFMATCERIGLVRYWNERGQTPDFMRFDD